MNVEIGTSYQRADSNLGPLMSEVIALSNVPQPLPEKTQNNMLVLFGIIRSKKPIRGFQLF